MIAFKIYVTSDSVVSRERERKKYLYLESIPRDDALMCNEQMQLETHLNTLCQLDNG